MFRALEGGVHMVFGNGVTLSITWKPGSYSDNYRRTLGAVQPQSRTAEVWGWRGQTDRYGNPSHPLWPAPLAYQTPEQVAAHIYYASQYPSAE